MAKDKLKKMAKAHIRYKTSDGKIVPGASTITGLLNKPMLVNWANRMGLDGVDTKKYVDKAASIGTLIHYLVECHITKEKPDLTDYTEQEIEIANVGFEKYLDWESKHKVEPIMNEAKFVSDKYKYGGTADFYCKLDGKYTLIDFKSCKAIYPEHFCQTSGYSNLLKENGHKVEQLVILRIGRDETEGFEEKYITPEQESIYFDIFKSLVDIYYNKKKVKWY